MSGSSSEISSGGRGGKGLCARQGAEVDGAHLAWWPAFTWWPDRERGDWERKEDKERETEMQDLGAARFETLR